MSIMTLWVEDLKSDPEDFEIRKEKRRLMKAGLLKIWPEKQMNADCYLRGRDGDEARRSAYFQCLAEVEGVVDEIIDHLLEDDAELHIRIGTGRILTTDRDAEVWANVVGASQLRKLAKEATVVSIGAGSEDPRK